MMTRILAKGYLWLLLALLYSPILIIMVFSFTEAKVLGNWTGFSTKLYSSLFTGGMHHSLTSAIWNTFAIAMLAATASTALGSIAAIGIFNLRTRTRRVMNFANAIPMMNADIITGVSLFLLFVSCGISQGFTTVVLAHITFCTPYVVLSVMPRLKKMNQNVYEAALDLGATPFQALRKVILPEILPGMISGWLCDSLGGYHYFFMWALLATVPAFLLAARIPFTYPDTEEVTAEEVDKELINE